MGGWHREHPELVGTDADPWMIHESYRRAVPTPEHHQDEPCSCDVTPPDEFGNRDLLENPDCLIHGVRE